MVGKGPTLDRLGEVDLDDYHVLALNQTLAALPRADIVHAIDLEPILELGPSLARARWILMPEVLKEKCRPGRTLEEAVRTERVLAQAAFDGKLVGYQRRVGIIQRNPGCIVARYFSSEAALCIIGLLGGKMVRTLGIDGGRRYGHAFAGKKPLLNGRASFDDQFVHMDAIARHYGLWVHPLCGVAP